MLLIKKITNIFKFFLIIILITFSLTLFIDFFFGKKILEATDNFWKKTEFYGRILRIDHPVYHHSLKKNVKLENAKGFDGLFTFCTDNHGFKNACNQKVDKEFEIGFLGDSFTEGASVTYEDSFVGIFKSSTKKDVANLGVVSYSPKIYLSKINYLLNEGYKFNQIVIFIDISDLYDDSFYYSLNDKLEVGENPKRGKKLFIRRILRSNFPFTNFYMYVLKNLNKKEEVDLKKINYTRPTFHKDAILKSIWTYSEKDFIEGYFGSISENQKKMLNTMDELYKLLEKKGIEMSLAVYPWPQQLEYDVENSEQVKMWENFCRNRCKHFFNFFPYFFESKNKIGYLDTYKKYYWWNDIHFNKAGNKVIAKELIKVLK